ncbi:MAG: glycosyltransferase family A protein [Pseudomonadota bacterium]
MKPVTAIIIEHNASPLNADLIASLKASPLIEKIIVLSGDRSPDRSVISISSSFPAGGTSLSEALAEAAASAFALILPSPAAAELTPDDIARLAGHAAAGSGALYYGDYYYEKRSPEAIRKVCAYQAGSIRDDFMFGPVQLFSMKHVQLALGKNERLADTQWAGLYELRLAASRAGAVVHIPEPLSLLKQVEKKSHFTYVDPRQLDFQKEMEQAATEHLKRIGAYCSHELAPAPKDTTAYPVEATIVIPVRNRATTIGAAVRSALSQKADFSFNVLVVQNHSTDGTAEEINFCARRDRRVVHLIPGRKDLGIGGCWNEAVHSAQCGKYVCQLDSDDLYSDENTLAAMMEKLRSGSYGMAVGSYRIVNFELQEIPPGIIDHKEWSHENGRNNLLRVNGIGAPRAFATVLLRQFPFPNVSYGEDYAVSLRISRDYSVGRIYEPVYLCRRWEDNTDAQLTNEQEVKLAAYKDSLRTQEILERQKLYKR